MEKCKKSKPKFQRNINLEENKNLKIQKSKVLKWKILKNEI
jgi:hypothetical protein